MVDDELKLRQDMGRAALAQAITENEIMVEAWDALEKSYWAAFKATKYDDDVARRAIWQAVNQAGKVQGHLVAVVANGQIAAKQIERDFRQPKRFGIV